MASGTYGNYWLKLISSGACPWSTLTMKCQLLSSSYTTVANKYDSQVFRSDCSALQLGGQTAQTIPATIATTLTTSDNKVYMDCGGAVTFTGVTATQDCGSLIVYRDSGNPNTDELIANLEFSGGTFPTNGQAITVNFNANGVASLQYE